MLTAAPADAVDGAPLGRPAGPTALAASWIDARSRGRAICSGGCASYLGSPRPTRPPVALVARRIVHGALTRAGPGDRPVRIRGSRRAPRGRSCRGRHRARRDRFRDRAHGNKVIIPSGVATNHQRNWHVQRQHERPPLVARRGKETKTVAEDERQERDERPRPSDGRSGWRSWRGELRLELGGPLLLTRPGGDSSPASSGDLGGITSATSSSWRLRRRPRKGREGTSEAIGAGQNKTSVHRCPPPGLHGRAVTHDGLGKYCRA